MSIRRRLLKLEKEAKQARPQRDRIACISTLGLSDAEVDAKIKEAQIDYFEEHGRMEGLIIFVHNMPEPDPLPDLNDPDACISGAEHLIE